MGIFADFINSRPMRIQEERIARRELEALRDQGDTEAPSAFAGRTGWAILKVLTLTNLTDPPTQGDLLGYQPQDIDYQRALISPDTAKVIANQIAIDDGNRGLEQDLLIHLDLCHSNPGEMCRNTPAAPNPYNWNPCVLTVNDYVHRWSADQQLLTDNTEVATVTDGGSGGINLSAQSGGALFKEDIFNSAGANPLPAFRFVTTGDGYLESLAAVSLYPAKRGTFVWLGVLREGFDFGAKIMANVLNNDDQLLFTDAADVASVIKTSNDIDGQVTLMTPPPNEFAANSPQLVIIMRDSDTSMRCRVNGQEEDGAVISDYTPVSNTFRAGFPTGGGSSLAIDHDLGVILSYDRVLSGGELTTLETELMACYGIIV